MPLSLSWATSKHVRGGPPGLAARYTDEASLSPSKEYLRITKGIFTSMAAHGEPLVAKKRLDSWKEIATFFGLDERTVKRWEKERGLPVYRVPRSA